MRRLLLVFFLSPFAFMALGHLGWLHPMFDSIAVFRQLFLWCGVIGVIGLGALGRPKLAALGAGYCVFIATTLWAIGGAPVSDVAWSVYQKNLLFLRSDKTPIIEDIIELKPNFVAFQEVSKANRAVLERLKPHYVAQHYCRFATVGGTAVLSTFPKIPNSGGCVGTDGASYMQVETPQGPVWIISVHLHWPWPFGQQGQVEKLLPKISALTGPKIIAGDFNMVPWTHRIRDFENRLGVQRVKGIQRSFNLKRILNIPIDHIFYSWPDPNNRTTLRPLLGSDHNGILAEIPRMN